MHLTKKTNQKVTYKLIDNKLCIEHHILLQQLIFRKKTKNNEYKEYYSYFIKLPRAIYNLLSPEDDIVYLTKNKEKIHIYTEAVDNSKKVHIQIDNRSQKNNMEYNRYKLTIPKKFITKTNYKHEKSYILCQIKANNNKRGYEITLKQI